MQSERNLHFCRGQRVPGAGRRGAGRPGHSPSREPLGRAGPLSARVIDGGGRRGCARALRARRRVPVHHPFEGFVPVYKYRGMSRGGRPVISDRRREGRFFVHQEVFEGRRLGRLHGGVGEAWPTSSGILRQRTGGPDEAPVWS